VTEDRDQTQVESLQRQWLRLCVMILIVFGLPALLFRSESANKHHDSSSMHFRSIDRRDFDKRAIEQLQQTEPAYVLIGNSEVESAIDVGYLEQRIAPKRLSVLFVRGGVSTVWYLLLKHHVLASGVRPEWVFIFFRDNQLTLPGKESRALWEKIPTLIHSDDPVFDRVTEGIPSDWRERVTVLLEMIYPVQRKRSDVESWLRDISTRAWTAMPSDGVSAAEDARVQLGMETERPPLNSARSHIQQRINEEVFSLDRLRSDASGTLLDPQGHEQDEFDFRYWCPRSFLPPMLETAADAAVPLCFVKMKTRPDGDSMSNAKADFYRAHLADYLAERGSMLIDLSQNPEIDFTWFSNESHISPQFRRRFTELFYEASKSIFGAEASP